MFKYICTLLILLITLQAYALEVNVDRTNISYGESLTLTISTDNKSANKPPELSALSKDFKIINSTTSTAINYVNGKKTYLKSYIIALMPKRMGELVIPAINFAGETSNEITIQVEKVASAGSSQQNDVYIEINSTPKVAYVDEEITYTVKIYKKASAAVFDLSLTEPEFNEADVIQLDKDLRYSATKNGESYQVLERRYAIFIHKPGAITINSPILTGKKESAATNHRFDPLGVFDQSFFGSSILNNTKPFSLSSATTIIDIMPIPSIYPKNKAWLPAKNIIMSDTLSPEVTSIEAGNPITRTITIQALGLMYNYLPDLSVNNYDENVKVYQNQSVGENKSTIDAILSTNTQKIAYVANNTQNIVLPEHELTWWNTKTNSVEHTRLASRTIKVIPAAITNTTKDNLSKNETSMLNMQQSFSLDWKLIALFISVIGWVVLLFFIVIKKHPKKNKPKQIISKKNTSSKQALLSACASNNSKLITKALLVYIQEKFSTCSFSSVSDLKKLLPNNSQWQDLIHKLEQGCYAKQAVVINGASIIEMLPNLDTTPAVKKSAKNILSLENLFKISKKY